MLFAFCKYHITRNFHFGLRELSQFFASSPFITISLISSAFRGLQSVIAIAEVFSTSIVGLQDFFLALLSQLQRQFQVSKRPALFQVGGEIFLFHVKLVLKSRGLYSTWL